MTAYCHALRHFQGWVAPDDTHEAEGVRLAWDAVELAPKDAEVLWMAAGTGARRRLNCSPARS